MTLLRTPDERFDNLPGYPFAPQYHALDELRLHYVDEGPRAGPVVLMLHGEPTWSYLYRTMIPVFVAAGYRAIAPDLIGFGKSDKLIDRAAYTYARHVAWMWHWLAALDLHDITLVCQDWGSLIGLRLVAEHPERFARVALANGGLPTGDSPMSGAFRAWVTFSQATPILPIGQLIQQGTVSRLPKNVVAAYNAPFPSERYKAAPRMLPVLVPTRPDDPAAEDNRRAWESLKRFDKPFLTAFSDKDAISAGGERLFQDVVPGAQGQPHRTIADAGHFLQEDKGQELAQVVVQWHAGLA